jgi:hypothetical protein
MPILFAEMADIFKPTGRIWMPRRPRYDVAEHPCTPGNSSASDAVVHRAHDCQELLVTGEGVHWVLRAMASEYGY